MEKSCQISDVKKTTDYILVEDESETGVRSNEEISEDQCLILCAPSTSQLSTASTPPSNGSFDEHKKSVNMTFETRSKEESIRQLIAQIRYMKSKLCRAESDQRKKQMLKTILGLQKKVKALTKGMRKAEVTKESGCESRETTSGLVLPEVNNHTDSESRAAESTIYESQDQDISPGSKCGGEEKRKLTEGYMLNITLHVYVRFGRDCKYL